jgi:hypothetical protein
MSIEARSGGARRRENAHTLKWELAPGDYFARHFLVATNLDNKALERTIKVSGFISGMGKGMGNISDVPLKNLDDMTL